MRLLSVFLALFVSAVVGFTASAQNPKGDAPPELHRKGFQQLEQSGKLFTVRLQPKDKELRLFVVGNEAARIDLEEFTVHAKWIRGEKESKLKVEPVGEYFRLHQAPEGPGNLEITLKPKKEKEHKAESFKLRLN